MTSLRKICLLRLVAFRTLTRGKGGDLLELNPVHRWTMPQT